MTIEMKEEVDTTVAKLEQGLVMLHDLFRKQRVLIEKKYGISAQEMYILQFVVVNGPQKMKDIAEEFHIKLSTLTSTIDKAEKRKILKRVNSKDDRRVVFLDITAKGRKMVEDYAAYLKELVSRTESNFQEEDLNIFVNGLEKLARISIP
jgi:MarR family 2-MHQ and catechol resistance regulon transcriptional repressor